MTAAEKKAAREAKNQKAIADGGLTDIEKLNQASFAGQHPGSLPTVAQTRTRQYIVACKLGVRLFRIQHTEMVEKFEQNMQGGRMVKEGRPSGPAIELRGTSYPRGTVPDGYGPPPLIVDGAALNFGIDADWFDEWLRQHEKDPIVVNKLIFCHEKQDHVEGMARESREIKSGLDPVNPKSDPRMPRSNRGEIDDVTKDDARLGARRKAG